MKKYNIWENTVFDEWGDKLIILYVTNELPFPCVKNLNMFFSNLFAIDFKIKIIFNIFSTVIVVFSWVFSQILKQK